MDSGAGRGASMSDLAMPAMCQVDRRVLVSMLGRLGSYADQFGEEVEQDYYRLANAFESRARDRLTVAEWREIGGGD